ncbi:telomerase inhibitor [Hypocenomyce scalaris]|nr:telomerase inhibitor [Hypocenomyce scalaris]
MVGNTDGGRRAKLSHDPNNTAWSRSTSNFGHKILTAQGWMPGEFLGTKGAPHAKLHTQANASHIRVALKDDNLGLGAKSWSSQSEGQCTGLDAFQGLLGRLNGKNERELQNEQKSRDDLKRAIYTESRWGFVRFVSGGLLVGDKIQKLADDQAKRLRSSLLVKPDGQVGVSLQHKQAAGQHKMPVVETGSVDRLAKKKSPKPPNPRQSVEAEVSDRHVSVSSVKSEANACNEEQRSIPGLEVTQSLSLAMENSMPKPLDPDKAKRKAEKKRRKQERELRRATRKSRRVQQANQSTAEGAEESTQVECKDGSVALLSSSTKPAPSRIPSSSAVVEGRHAVRQRYIQHKKMAMMDSKALNEVSGMRDVERLRDSWMLTFAVQILMIKA